MLLLVVHVCAWQAKLSRVVRRWDRRGVRHALWMWQRWARARAEEEAAGQRAVAQAAKASHARVVQVGTGAGREADREVGW